MFGRISWDCYFGKVLRCCGLDEGYCVRRILGAVVLRRMWVASAFRRILNGCSVEADLREYGVE